MYLYLDQLSFEVRMALDGKLLLIIAITMEQTFGVAIDQGGRERSGREKWFKSYNVLVNHIVNIEWALTVKNFLHIILVYHN